MTDDPKKLVAAIVGGKHKQNPSNRVRVSSGSNQIGAEFQGLYSNNRVDSGQWVRPGVISLKHHLRRRFVFVLQFRSHRLKYGVLVLLTLCSGVWRSPNKILSIPSRTQLSKPCYGVTIDNCVTRYAVLSLVFSAVHTALSTHTLDFIVNRHICIQRFAIEPHWEHVEE